MVTFAFATATVVALAPAQTAVPETPGTPADCTCAAAVADLAEVLETDYAAFVMDVRRNRLDAWGEALTAATAEARDTPPAACLPLLQRLVAFFRDGHVFVSTYPRLSAADSARLAASARTVEVDEAALRARWLDDPGTLDPVEGLWYDATGLRVAVVPDPHGPAGSFVGVHLEGAPGWERGHVKAELRRLADGSYDVTYHGGAHERLHPHVYHRDHEGGGVLRRSGMLLHMPPYTWGRLLPVPPDLTGALDLDDPRAPTARTIGDSVVVFSVPSHVPSHRDRLEALVDRHALALRGADLLIVDLRGNEGGSAGTTNPLLPYIVTADEREDRRAPEGESGVLASPANLATIERMMSQGWIPQGLPDRMRASPGEVVPFADPAPPGEAAEEAAPEPPVVAEGGPRRVAILLDGGAVSAAEAFLLRVMSSTRVTLFGAPSGGTIDYQTVSVRRFGCPELDLAVGIPLFVGSLDLPEGGINPTGIVPDVAIDPDDDPIAAILGHYRGGVGGR